MYFDWRRREGENIINAQRYDSHVTDGEVVIVSVSKGSNAGRLVLGGEDGLRCGTGDNGHDGTALPKYRRRFSPRQEHI